MVKNILLYFPMQYNDSSICLGKSLYWDPYFSTFSETGIISKIMQCFIKSYFFILDLITKSEINWLSSHICLNFLLTLVCRGKFLKKLIVFFRCVKEAPFLYVWSWGNYRREPYADCQILYSLCHRYDKKLKTLKFHISCCICEDTNTSQTCDKDVTKSKKSFFLGRFFQLTLSKAYTSTKLTDIN